MKKNFLDIKKKLFRSQQKFFWVSKKIFLGVKKKKKKKLGIKKNKKFFWISKKKFLGVKKKIGYQKK